MMMDERDSCSFIDRKTTTDERTPPHSVQDDHHNNDDSTLPPQHETDGYDPSLLPNQSTCCCCYRPCCCGAPTTTTTTSTRTVRPWFFRGNQQAIAWCLDSIGRTTSVTSLGAFLMPAILVLARENAGCDPDDRDCSNDTTYGIKPGSVLTTTQTVVSVLASPLLPLMGAIVDYTPHRLRIGRILSTSFCAFLFPLIFISSTTWFALSILIICIFLLFEFQMVMSYAYLPELTPNEGELRDFTRNFTVVTFSFVVLYVAILIGCTTGTGIADDQVLVARISMSACFAIATITLGLAWWKLFRPRPPLHVMNGNGENGSRDDNDAHTRTKPNVWTAGFVKLGRSIRLLRSQAEYRPLLWFNLAVLFSDSGLQSLPTILITFFTDQLGFTSAEMGATVFLLLLSIVPAGFLSAVATRKLGNDPIRSVIISMLIIIVTTTVAAAVLTPSSSNDDDGFSVTPYILVVFWGIGNGWKWTCDRLASGALCPPNQSGEFMGLYLFSTIALTWLPPLVFTVLNEAGVPQQVGIATLNIWFLLSTAAYACMGSYRRAVTTIASTGASPMTMATTTEAEATTTTTAAVPAVAGIDASTTSSVERNCDKECALSEEAPLSGRIIGD